MYTDKAYLRHLAGRFRRVKVWLLVVLVAVFAAASALLLRQNNLGMVTRRHDVVVADEKNGDIEGALEALRAHTMRHMNTRMSEPVQLKYSYERAVQQQLNEAAKSGTATDAAAYQRAQEECRTANTVTYAQCVIDKTSQVAPGSDPITQITPPRPELFSYQFYSPAWSPDLAGWVVLALILTLLLLVIRVVGERAAWFLLRRRQHIK